MNALSIWTLVLLLCFYAAYLSKMYMLKRQGIEGNLLGKGEKPRKVRRNELCLQFATLLGAAIQFVSAVWSHAFWPLPLPTGLRICGVALVGFGNVFFIAAIVTMRDNWRAGFVERQRTRLVTGGIYRLSRNPAFVGFDLLYIGCALACPNFLTIATAIAAVLLFHIQIRGEETYLAQVFGPAYAAYCAKVRRYL